MSMFSKKNAHLVSVLGKILSEGAVDQVIINETSAAAMNVRKDYKSTSKAVIPTPDMFPPGFTEKAANGLLDHELSHGLFTTSSMKTPVMQDYPGVASSGALFSAFSDFAKGFHNTLEDRRIEPLYADKYPGGGENLDALNTYAIQVLIPMQLNDPKLPILSKVDLSLNAFILKGLSQEIAELATWPDRIDDLKALEALKIAVELREPAREAVAKAKVTADLDKPACDISYEIFKRLSVSDLKDQEEQAKKQADTKKAMDDLRKALKEGLQKALDNLKDNLKEQEDLSEKIKDLEEKKAKGEDVDGELQEAKDALADLKKALKPMPISTMGDNEDFSTEHDPNGTLGMGGINDLTQKSMGEPTPTEAEADVLEDALNTGLMMPIYMDNSKMPIKQRISAMDATLSGDLVKHLTPSPEKYLKLKSDLGSSISALSRVLRLNLDALARVKTMHEQDAGDLDMKTLHKLAAKTSELVFSIRRQAKQLKTAVTLLVDLSGSMEGPKLTHAVRLCTALYEALKPLKIDIEILGFTTGGSYGVPVRAKAMHYVAKSFKEKTPFCIPSFFDVSHDCNADPDAIRWAARRLLANPSDRRILLVLSDGQPSCAVNHSVVNSSALLEKDLVAAIRSCLKHGVEVIGFGLCDSSVKDFYPWHVVVNDAASLSTDVLITLQKALKASPVETLKRMEKLIKMR